MYHMKLQLNKGTCEKDVDQMRYSNAKTVEPSFRDDFTRVQRANRVNRRRAIKECFDTIPTENAPLIRRYPTRVRNKHKRLIEECQFL